MTPIDFPILAAAVLALAVGYWLIVPGCTGARDGENVVDDWEWGGRGKWLEKAGEECTRIRRPRNH
jgi:hypothetical protein